MAAKKIPAQGGVEKALTREGKVRGLDSVQGLITSARISALAEFSGVAISFGLPDQRMAAARINAPSWGIQVFTEYIVRGINCFITVSRRTSPCCSSLFTAT